MNANAPIHSTFADDPDMLELVEMFVAAIDARVQSLRIVFATGDAETLRNLAHQLKGAAGGYGFDPVSQAAARVESPLKEGARLESVKDELDTLLNICRRCAV